MKIENTVNDVQDTVVEYPEKLNAVNDAGTEVVHPSESEAGTVEGELIRQSSEAVAKPRQSSEENSRYAEMRREAENYRNKYSSLEESVKDILPGLKEYGFNGETLEDIAMEMKASKMGVTVDEYKNSELERKSELEKAIAADPRIAEAERITREAQFGKDLAAVKAAFPKVSANSVSELGEVFMRSMAAGLSPEDAYAAQLNYNKRTTKPSPPKMGTVQQSYEPEKETFSEDELASFKKDELVKNPKLLEKAMRSMIKKKV